MPRYNYPPDDERGYETKFHDFNEKEGNRLERMTAGIYNDLEQSNNNPFNIPSVNNEATANKSEWWKFFKNKKNPSEQKTEAKPEPKPKPSDEYPGNLKPDDKLYIF